jgi:hypothetical protein
MNSVPIKNVKDLKVYNQSFELAIEVFNLTKGFPKEELYSLTDQIRRSSRSVTANIREGYANRNTNLFSSSILSMLTVLPKKLELGWNFLLNPSILPRKYSTNLI